MQLTVTAAPALAISPLRYPGGKARYAPVVSALVRASATRVLVEPFAGGAGLGLRLLADGDIETLVLVDSDPAVSAFWVAATRQSSALAEAFAAIEPTMESFMQCRQRVLDNDCGTVDLAAAFLFVNRCSRSGSLRTGPVGGRSQDGRYGLLARYNRDSTLARLARVAALADRIDARHGDALDVLEDAQDDPSTLFFVDPPYVRAGAGLYRHSMDAAAHTRLRDALEATAARWVLTYDDHALVRDLYQGYRLVPVSTTTTAHTTRSATELFITGPTPVRAATA